MSNKYSVVEEKQPTHITLTVLYFGKDLITYSFLVRDV